MVQRSDTECATRIINNSYRLDCVLAKNSQRIVEHESQVLFQHFEKHTGVNVSFYRFFQTVVGVQSVTLITPPHRFSHGI